MKKVVYVGPFAFPSSNANSLRVKGMSEALALAGYDVLICAGLPSSKGSKSGDIAEDVHVESVDEYGGGLFSSINRGLRGLMLGDITVKWLESQENKPDCVVLYGTHLGYLLRLIPFCKKYDVPLFLDVVEWYDPRHLPMGVFGPFAIANEVSMRFMARRASGVFVISRYLQNHFNNQGCRTLRVPPLFSNGPARPKQYSDKDEAIHFCYAGSPGAKDDLEPVICGLRMAQHAGISFVMHIIGITEAEFFLLSQGFDDPCVAVDNLRFYGRLNNVDAKAIVAACDYLVLIRKDRRYSKAGFPSKVGESMSLGTPVIANLSSNLDEYLVEGENSIVVKGWAAIDFFEAVCRAASVGRLELAAMKIRAKAVGGQFSPKDKSLDIAEFIEKVFADGW